MTTLYLNAISQGQNYTLGELNGPGFDCVTMQDGPRDVKEWGLTRIPAGTYLLGLRTFGGFHERYAKKYPKMHVGMIELLNVPNFTAILIHIGNTPKDTAGCILVGAKKSDTENDRIQGSAIAYAKVYPRIVALMKRGPVQLVVSYA